MHYLFHSLPSLLPLITLYREELAAETYLTLGGTDSTLYKSLSTIGCASHLAQCLETHNNDESWLATQSNIVDEKE